MHIQKVKAGDFCKLKKEAVEREGSKVGTIDPERQELNFSLCATVAPDNIEELDERIRALGVKRKIRADAVRAISVILDYPDDESADVREYFEIGKEHILSYFGVKEEAVLYAEVHMDERHPHMHLAFVPLVRAVKKGKDGEEIEEVRLSAKDILTQESMLGFHPQIQRAMSAEGFCGTLHRNDGTRRDKDFMEHKLTKLAEEIEAQEAELKEVNQELKEKKTELNAVKFELSKSEMVLKYLKKDIEVAEKRLAYVFERFKDKLAQAVKEWPTEKAIRSVDAAEAEALAGISDVSTQSDRVSVKELLTAKKAEAAEQTHNSATQVRRRIKRR